MVKIQFHKNKKFPSKRILTHCACCIFFCVVSLFYSSACILSHCRFLWSDFFSALHQSHFSWWQYSDYDTRRLHPLSCLSLHFPPRTLTCEKHKKYAFFVCFRPFLGQTDNHISWVTLKPFASISPTDPRTNPAQFHKKKLRIDGFEKNSFFEFKSMTEAVILTLGRSRSSHFKKLCLRLKT